MVKVVARNRAGGYQRLVVMTEKEYEELRAVSILHNKKTEPVNNLVDKYLGENAYPGLSTSERLSFYNQAVAREEATRQFTEGRYTTSTTKPQLIDAPATTTTTTGTTGTTVPEQLQSADVPNTTRASEEPTSSIADGKEEAEAQEQDTKDAKTNELPSVRVPVVYGPKLSALKTVLETSGTVSVDTQGRVYIDRTLLDENSNYFDLMRSLFVNAKKDAKLAGRERFIEHLHKLGISANQVSIRSAKTQLQLLASQTGKGIKRQRKPNEKCKTGSCPPGKRPKVLLMYR
jgi:hypothetical protein